MGQCHGLVAAFSVLPSGMYWGYGDGDWRAHVGAAIPTSAGSNSNVRGKGRQLVHFLKLASPSRRGALTVAEELGGGELEQK